MKAKRLHHNFRKSEHHRASRNGNPAHCCAGALLNQIKPHGRRAR
jgi:hypothetical protein